MAKAGSTIVLKVDANTASAIKKLARVGKEGSRSLMSLEKSAKFAGRALGALAGAIAVKEVVSGLSAATKAAGDFEIALQEIQTILPKNAKSNKQLGKELLALQARFGGKAVKQAKAFYQVVSAGITDAAEANDVLVQSNTLAQAGLGDLEATVDIVTSALNNYKTVGLTATEVSDLLFNTVKGGKTTLEELASSLGKALPVASSLGVTFDQVTASIATLTAGGIKTAESVTGLRALFTAIASKQSVAASKGEKLAEAFSLQSLAANGLGKFISNVNRVLGGNVTKLQELLGSTEAVTAFQVLAANETKNFTAALEANAKASGVAVEAASLIGDTFNKQVDILKALAEQFAIGVGEGFGEGFLEEFKDINAAFKELLPLGGILGSNLAISFKPFIKAALFALRQVSKLKLVGVSIAKVWLDAFTLFAKVVSNILTIPFRIVSTGFLLVQKGLDQLLKLLTKLPKSLGGIGVEAATTIRDGFGKAEEALDGLVDKIVSLPLDPLKEKQDEVNQSFEDAKKEYLEIAKAINRAEFALDGYVEGADSATDATEDLADAVTQVGDNLGNLKPLTSDPFAFPTAGPLAPGQARQSGLSIDTLPAPAPSDPGFIGPQLPTTLDKVIQGFKKVGDAVPSVVSGFGQAASVFAQGAQSFQNPEEAAEKAREGREQEAQSIKNSIETNEKLAGGISDLRVALKEARLEGDIEALKKLSSRLDEAIKAQVEAGRQRRELALLEKQTADDEKKAREEAVEANRKAGLESARAVGTSVLDNVLPGLGQIFNLFTQDPEAAKGFIDSFLQAIPVLIETLADNFGPILTALIDGIISALPSIVDALILALPKIAFALVDVLITKGGIFRLAGALIQGMVRLAASLVGLLVQGIATGLRAFIQGFVTNLVQGGAEFLGGLFVSLRNSIRSVLLAIPNAIARGFGTAINNLIKRLSDFFADLNPFGGGGGGGLLGGSIIPGVLNQGGIVKANDGLLVPGSGNTDSVPALLTPGELVIPRNATQNFAQVVGEVARNAVGAGSNEGESKMISIQLILNEEILAEQILNLNQNNARLA